MRRLSFWILGLFLAASCSDSPGKSDKSDDANTVFNAQCGACNMSTNLDVQCVDGQWCHLPSVRDLRGVWGVSYNDWWGVGENGLVLHGSGPAWTVVESPTDAQLHVVWGRGPDDVWIGGASGTVLHWDGDSLKDMTASPAPQTLFGSIGELGGDLHFGAREALWRMNSDGSFEVVLETWADRLEGIVECQGAFWAAGVGQVFRSEDGANWERLEIGHRNGGVQNVIYRSADDVLVVTDELLRWDGAVWRRSQSEPNTEVVDAAVAADGTLRVLRASGEFYAVDGPTWTLLDDFEFDDPPRFSHLWMAPDGGAYFVGGAWVFHWPAGGELTTIEQGSFRDIRDVHWFDDGSFVAVGSDDLVFWDGAAYTDPVTLPDDANFTTLWASSSTDVWLAGRDGAIAHYDGTRIATRTPGVQLADGAQQWRDIFGTDGAVWLVGANDVLRFNADDTVDRWPEINDSPSASSAQIVGQGADMWLIRNSNDFRRLVGDEWEVQRVNAGIHDLYCVDDQLLGVGLESTGIERWGPSGWTEVAPLLPVGDSNIGAAWIGSPTYGWLQGQHDGGIKRIMEFDGEELVTFADEVGSIWDIWGWDDGGVGAGSGGIWLLRR